MYKHIVVAVDGSRTSLNALQHASSLAVAGNARLTLITVANPSEYMTLAPEFLQHDSYEAAAVAGGNEVLAEAREAAKNAGVADVQAHLLVYSEDADESENDREEFSSSAM